MTFKSTVLSNIAKIIQSLKSISGRLIPFWNIWATLATPISGRKSFGVKSVANRYLL